jgi:hypothetical protein
MKQPKRKKEFVVTEPDIILDVAFVCPSGRSQRTRPPGRLTANDLEQYAASDETRRSAITELQSLGFRLVGPPSQFGVTIAGPRSIVERVFGTENLLVPPLLSNWIEDVTRPQPARFD